MEQGNLKFHIRLIDTYIVTSVESILDPNV